MLHHLLLRLWSPIWTKLLLSRSPNQTAMLILVTLLFHVLQVHSFVALVVEDGMAGTQRSRVDGSLCTIYSGGGGETPLEEVVSIDGLCTFTETITGGEQGDIIQVRDIIPEDGYNFTTNNAPHAVVTLKIYDPNLWLVIPFLAEPAPGEIVVFMVFTMETAGVIFGGPVSLHTFLPEEFNCTHLYEWDFDETEYCYGQNATFCNGQASLDSGSALHFREQWVFYYVVRIKDINPGRYIFAVHITDILFGELDYVYMGMSFGGRIPFGSNTQSSAGVLPQSSLVALPNANNGAAANWWHAFTIDVDETTEATQDCQRTVEIWKVNRFCNDCAPVDIDDNTPLLLNTTDTEGQLLESSGWADCIWAIKQSNCMEYTPPVFNHSSSAMSWGDPHFKTNDDLFFDVFERGTYNYFHSAEMKVDIQARLAFLKPHNLSYSGQVVIAVEGNTFGFAAQTNGDLVAEHNGDLSFLERTGIHYFGDDNVHRVEIQDMSSGERSYYFFLYGGQMEINVATMLLPGRKRDFDFLGVKTKDLFMGVTEGLLGDFNHDQSNDFVFRGLNFTMKTASGSMKFWADRWLVPDPTTNKLLQVDSGGGDLFSDFLDTLYTTDPDFDSASPGPPVTLAITQAAQDACAILYPDQVARKFEYESCVMDASYEGGDQFVLNTPSYRTCTNACNNHGSCQEYDVCDCAPGFKGRWCDTPECFCLNGATCSDQGFCECSSGWVGPYCEQEVDCSSKENCHADQGGGRCIRDGVCQCNTGFSGPHCGVVYAMRPSCEILFNPYTDKLECYGFCNNSGKCGTLPEAPYNCYCMEELHIVDPGYCLDIQNCTALNPNLVTCEFDHCFCKNPPNICTGTDCLACTGCVPGLSECTGDSDRYECLDNACTCLYGGSCIGNDCGSCKNQFELTIRPSGSTTYAGTWRMFSSPWQQQDLALLENSGFDVTVQQPESTSATDLVQTLSDALTADPNFNDSCQTEYTGLELVISCTPLDAAFLVEFNGSDSRFLKNANLNGVSFDAEGYCFNVGSCTGTHADSFGCLYNQCTCLLGGVCNHTDCDQCEAPPTDTPTHSPTDTPTYAPTNAPIEVPAPGSCDNLDEHWQDSEGQSCTTYEEYPEFCAVADQHSQSDGKHAGDICCVCGGGITNYCWEAVKNVAIVDTSLGSVSADITNLQTDIGNLRTAVADTDALVQAMFDIVQTLAAHVIDFCDLSVSKPNEADDQHEDIGFEGTYLHLRDSGRNEFPVYFCADTQLYIFYAISQFIDIYPQLGKGWVLHNNIDDEDYPYSVGYLDMSYNIGTGEELSGTWTFGGYDETSQNVFVKCVH